MMTLTIKDGSELRERIKHYQEALSRFYDIRLGKRNIERFTLEADSFYRDHINRLSLRGDLTSQEASYKLTSWERSVNKFNARLIKLVEKNKGKKYPRVRELFGLGVAVFECTYNLDWHPHRHVVTDAGYIPWAFLVVLWRFATRGEGEIIDIRPIGKTSKDLKEVFKYLSKFWEIPEEKKKEFREAVKHLRRVQPMGGAKPDKIDKVCPFCGSSACHARLLGLGESYQRVKFNGLDVLKIFREGGSSVDWFYKDDGQWKECPREVVYLILRDLSCQTGDNSPPGGAINWALAGF